MNASQASFNERRNIQHLDLQASTSALTAFVCSGKRLCPVESPFYNSQEK